MSETLEHAAGPLAGIVLLVMDNGDQAILVNGTMHRTCRASAGEASLVRCANAMAEKTGGPLRYVELPSEGKEDTRWPDVIARLAVAGDGRRRVTVIEARLDAGRALHFCGHPVLSGADSNLWFPLRDDEDLFQAVERIMVMNHQAVNVTGMTPVVEYPAGRDWQTTYNVRLTDKGDRS